MTQQYTRRIHILEACSDPERRPRPAGLAAGLAVLSMGWRAIETPQDLADALACHQSPDDVPANTGAAHEDLARLLRSGQQLVQSTLTVPDPAAEREQGPAVVRRRVAAGTLVLGAWQLAGLLAVSRRHAFHAFDHGLVDVVLSAWRGAPYRYAIVNERMAAWSRRHARWVPREKVARPASTGGLDRASYWFAWEDLEAASGRPTTMFMKADPITLRPLVYASYPMLRWVAGRRPAAELEAILNAQVTE